MYLCMRRRILSRAVYDRTTDDDDDDINRLNSIISGALIYFVLAVRLTSYSTILYTLYRVIFFNIFNSFARPIFEFFKELRIL